MLLGHSVEILYLAYHFPLTHRLLVELVHSTRYLPGACESHLLEVVLKAFIPFLGSGEIVGSIKSRRLLPPEPLVDWFANLIHGRRHFRYHRVSSLGSWLCGRIRKVLFYWHRRREVALPSHSSDPIVARESPLGHELGLLVALPSIRELHLVSFE